MIKNKNIVLDIKTIPETKKLMDEKYSELIEMMNNYQKMINDTISIYDTESATLYRKLAETYINYIKGYLNNDFKNYINRLDEIEKVYQDEYTSIDNAIKGVK